MASAVKVTDGRWHEVEVRRRGQSAEVTVDGQEFAGRVRGSHYELNVPQAIYLGKDRNRQ